MRGEYAACACRLAWEKAALPFQAAWLSRNIYQGSCLDREGVELDLRIEMKIGHSGLFAMMKKLIL